MGAGHVLPMPSVHPVPLMVLNTSFECRFLSIKPRHVIKRNQAVLDSNYINRFHTRYCSFFSLSRLSATTIKYIIVIQVSNNIVLFLTEPLKEVHNSSY